MDTTKISRRTIFNNYLLGSTAPRNPSLASERNRSSGFTLFEILIVLGVIAGTMALLIPQIRKSDNGVKKTAHHLTVLTKDIRTQARLKNRTFRLVLNMDGEPHSYWVESAAGLVIPKTLEQVEAETRLSDEEKPKEQFTKEEKYTKKEFQLPKKFFIGQVETPSRKDPVTSGLAYIYFSPQGLVEPSIIQLTNRGSATISVIVNPLTGHSDVVDKAVALRDTREK